MPNTALLRNFRSRNINAEYFETSEQAVPRICSLILPNALVGLGGSETIIQCGLLDALRNLDIMLLDRYKPGTSAEEVSRMRREGMMSDVFICSSNAITRDGKLVNKDGLGNRLACITYGPEKVFIVAGMNKVVDTVEDALERIRTIAAPLNAQRVGAETHCFHTGVCNDDHCFPPDRICNQLLITEGSRIEKRIHVFLVNEELGY